VAVADQALNAMGEDGSLARARTRYHQHGAVNVLDGFALTIIGNKRSGAGTDFRRRH
jgi:hypothetical protein